jgi:CBS domain-containing protein
MEVKEVLQVKDSALFAVHPDSPLSEAVIMMADNDIGSVIVMEGGKLAGMLTFREVLSDPRQAPDRAPGRPDAADRRDPGRRGDGPQSTDHIRTWTSTNCVA